MSIDPFEDSMAQFKLTFFDECKELLESVEALLDQIDADADDLEVFNGIFRAVHSIKAGAGMFDYKQLVRFSHLLEALLDLLRTEKLSPSDNLIALLFQACDKLAELIEAAEQETELGHAATRDLEVAMQDWLHGEGDTQSPQKAPQENTESTGEDPVTSTDDNDIPSFDVVFKPYIDMYQKANEPLLLIGELQEIGGVDVTLNTSSVPPLESIDAEAAYFTWALTVKGENVTQEAIEEVFEFVEGDCDLVITAHHVPSREEEDESGFGLFADEPGGDIVVTVAGEAAGSDTAAPKAAAVQQSVAEPTAPIVPSAPAAPPKSAAAGGGAAPKPASAAPKRESIRVDLDRIDRLVNMVGELVITQSMLSDELSNMVELRNSKLLNGIEELSVYTRELQENVMAIRMQPVKSVFSRMPRLVRDLSSKLGKKVSLEMKGESTEVDKTVIEELTDPLTHMIRNSLDHGIESPEERAEAGKEEQGTITLSAEHKGGRIIIEIIDDGRGINRPKVLQIARDRGVVGEEELSDEEIDNLIFAAGFSTADKVTDVSGRGVGMDVVRRNIQALGGRINLSSDPGQGSRFTLSLPLTLAVLDGMIVGAGDQKFVVPVNSIVESLRPTQDQISALPNGTELVFIRGEYIPMLRLASVLEVPNAQSDPTKGLIVIVEAAGGSNLGVMVDSLHGQQQVVIKSLESNYKSLRGISAATILGNGQVCLILDVDGMQDIARESGVQISPSVKRMLEERDALANAS